MTNYISVQNNGDTNVFCEDLCGGNKFILNVNLNVKNKNTTASHYGAAYSPIFREGHGYWGHKLLEDISRRTEKAEQGKDYESDYKLWIYTPQTNYLPIQRYPLSPNQVMWKLFDFKCCSDNPAEYIDKDGKHFCVNCFVEDLKPSNFKHPNRCSKFWNVEKQKHEWKQYLGAGHYCSPELID